MITFRRVTKIHGERVLFSEVNLQINRGEKIGLIGPNGTGKSTLFSILLGKTECSAGSVRLNKGIRIGYLPQESRFASSRSVISEVTEGHPAIEVLKEEKRRLEAADEAHFPRYGDVMDELEFLGYFEIEHKAKRVLSGLGFKEADFTRMVSQLSGGWQMRTLLAKLLVLPYDVLLLDEPTNYLDLNAALWLEEYLKNLRGTFVIVSHDHDYLNDVTSITWVLEHGVLTRVKGNYRQYLEQREKERERLIRQHAEQEKKRQQLQKFIYRFHAQPNKAAQVRAKKRMLEKIKPVVVFPDRRQSIRSFSFPVTARSAQRVISLKHITKSYGQVQVYRDFSFEMHRGEKAVLVGENGAGKSTLLKIMAGVLDIDEGTRTVGVKVSVGYFSQTRMDVLNEHNTVLDELLIAAAGLTAQEARTLLGVFLFTGDDVDKKVSILSGGEKSRLILAKLLSNPPNFLLLDEPTTHLDTDAVEALIKALIQYDGTLVCISHDIHFVRSVANTVYEVRGGRVRKFTGSFDYYRQKSKEDSGVEKSLSHHAAPAQDKGKNTSQYIVPEDDEGERLQKKTHNTHLARKIKKLKKKKETLEVERNAKARILDNPRHGDDVIKYYRVLVDDFDSRIKKINKEIKKTEKEFLP